MSVYHPHPPWIDLQQLLQGLDSHTSHIASSGKSWRVDSCTGEFYFLMPYWWIKSFSIFRGCPQKCLYSAIQNYIIIIQNDIILLLEFWSLNNYLYPFNKIPILIIVFVHVSLSSPSSLDRSSKATPRPQFTQISHRKFRKILEGQLG